MGLINYKILADNKDITDLIRDRLLSLRITDEPGIVSDVLEIQLDDRPPQIAWPEHYPALEVFLSNQSNDLYRMGLYTVDELSHQSPPATLTIQAKAADMRATLKAPQTKSFDDITIGDLVATIAANHNLKPKVSPTLATIKLLHLDQSDESDLHLITRLAKITTP